MDIVWQNSSTLELKFFSSLECIVNVIIHNSIIWAYNSIYSGIFGTGVDCRSAKKRAFKPQSERDLNLQNDNRTERSAEA